jgi:NAD-dependent SIR2 family protein deacetylase
VAKILGLNMRNPKTVYILGAGISKSDGLPLQSELLKQIFSLYPDIGIASILQLPINKREQQILQYFEEFEKQRQNLADFIVDKFSSKDKQAEYNSLRTLLNYNLPISDDTSNRMNKIASEVNVTLEDLFTLFDKIILGHEHFQNYSTEKIVSIHQALRKCIIFLLAYKSSEIEQKKTKICQLFARRIFETRMKSNQKDDVLSVITMNWDTLLESELFKLCKKYNSQTKGTKIYPDLCFYDYAFYNSDRRIVSTHIKTKGHRNLKILKLHGSINWLVCPYCGRVYVDYDEDIAVNILAIECICPECRKNFGSSYSPQMQSILITPTFLKDLNDLHIKHIWHNALIDLAEATHIVFIGYSFPDSDFEMRCLLKKSVQPGTMIEVVLHNEDNPNFYKTMIEKDIFDANTITSIMNKLNLPAKRYKAFFGDESLKIHYYGIEGYLEQEMSK